MSVNTKFVCSEKSKATSPVLEVSVNVLPTTPFEKVVTPVDAIVITSTSEATPIAFPSPMIISSVKVAIPVMAAVPLISTFALISTRVALSSTSSVALISNTVALGAVIF